MSALTRSTRCAAVADHANERAALPVVRTAIAIAGTVAPIHVIGCQRDAAGQIIDRATGTMSISVISLSAEKRLPWEMQ